MSSLRHTRRFALAATVASLQPACAPEGADPTATAQAEQPISQGADAYPDLSYTVLINWPGGACSGVLISPRWVLTANHCITGATGGKNAAGAGVTADLTVRIPEAAEDPYDAAFPAERIFTHKNAVSGDILVRQDTPIDGVSDSDTSWDLALFRLDQRVPSTIAKPPRLPILGGPTCPQSGKFDGTIVGFGGNKLVSGSDPTKRRYGEGDGWDRNYVILDDGAYYSRHWLIPGLYTDDFYGGVLSGDSGGPLVVNDPTGTPGESPFVLCGVASRYYPKNVWDCGAIDVPPFWTCGLMPALASDYAAADAPDTISFIEDAVVQSDGSGKVWLDGYCPDAPAGAEDFDPDADGIVEACDNCPGKKNPSQSDCDGDGVGDACDPCPCSTSDADGDGLQDCEDPCPADAGDGKSDAYGDADGDGVCNSADNCPNVPNASQRNTNLLSETFRGADARGDKCEPVPQPVTDVVEDVQEVFSAQNGSFASKYSQVTANTLRVFPEGSRSDGGPTWSAGPAETHFRFCQPGGNGLPPFCDDANAIDDAQLHTELAGPAFEQPWMPYHRVTLQGGQRGDTESLTYAFGTPQDFVWDYVTDANDWSQAGFVNLQNEAIDGEPASALDGIFWIHAATQVGSDAAHDIGAGWHGKGLANAHFSVRPRYGETWTASRPVAGIAPVLIWRTLPDPTPDGWRMDPVMQHASLLVAAPEGRFGLLDADGGLQVLDTERAGRLLADEGAVWASAAEPELAASEAPLAVAVSADGTRLLGGLGTDKAGALAQVDLGSDASPPPPPAKEMVPVYSRALHALFVITAGGVWRAAVGGGPEWYALPFDLTPGRPMAATVDARQGALFVLDEVDGREGASARLVRYDLRHGGARVLASWARGSTWDRHWLVLDGNGDLLLAASSATLAQNAVVRVSTAGGEARFATIRYGARALAWGPLVTESGYVSFPTDERGGLVPTFLDARGERPIRDAATQVGGLFQ